MTDKKKRNGRGKKLTPKEMQSILDGLNEAMDLLASGSRNKGDKKYYIPSKEEWEQIKQWVKSGAKL